MQKLERQVADLQCEIDKLKRTVSIRDHEIQLLAEIVARDRKRVQAETAVFAGSTSEAAQ